MFPTAPIINELIGREIILHRLGFPQINSDRMAVVAVVVIAVTR